MFQHFQIDEDSPLNLKHSQRASKPNHSATVNGSSGNGGGGGADECDEKEGHSTSKLADTFCSDIPSVSQYTFLGLYTCIVGTSFREISHAQTNISHVQQGLSFLHNSTRHSFFCMRYHD
jgi:hypothetical protein